MEMLWFAIAALMIAIYVVTDGFDFGAGALHLWIARGDRERRQVLAAIGPFWDGNEVWLIAGGGVLFLAFPRVLGSALSGFYLAIMLLLWMLIVRGIAIELRSHRASVLSALLFGVLLGNLVRGVPLREDGWFALSLFESLSPRGELGIFDWYTLLAGILALAALLHHGALFLAWKAAGEVGERGRRSARPLFWMVVALWAATTAASAAITPGVFSAFAARPLAWLAGLLSLGGLIGCLFARRTRRDLAAFLGSSAFLFGLLGATAASTYPTMIRSIGVSSRSLTALNSAASPASLRAGLLWWPIGLLLAILYFVLLFRLHRGKVLAPEGGDRGS